MLSKDDGLRMNHRRPNSKPVRIADIAILPVLLFLLITAVSCDFNNVYRGISGDELKKLIDAGAAILIVDNRSEYEYRSGHIPKAINVPQEHLSVLKMFLPKDKALPVVFYCWGAG